MASVRRTHAGSICAALVAAASASAQVVISDRAELQRLATQRGILFRAETPLETVELVRLIDGRPMYYTTQNINAADSVSADELWPGGSSGLNLSGAGVLLGIWDAGSVRISHQEFGGRVSLGDSPGFNSSHATHVTGTMIAAGVDPSARGMSFAGNVVSYYWNNDTNEMDTAAAAGLLVSNHSYGYVTGWATGDFGAGSGYYWFGDVTISTVEDFYFGFYSSEAQAWDQVCYDNPHYLPVKSAGNDRNDVGPGAGNPHFYWEPSINDWAVSTVARNNDGDYDCLSTTPVAKNILTVAAVEDVIGGYAGPASVAMTDFSSWGPTDDGRIKPDISANGRSLWSATAGSDTSYASFSGTSMSAPNTSGSLGLLIGHWRNTHPAAGEMRAATLKAVVIHTADECGASAGPDYGFGWGLLNAKSAANVISADVSQPLTMSEQTLASGGQLELYITTVASSPQLKATLVWTDPPGTPPAAALDPPNKMLVNDLDLRLIRDVGGAVFSPWRLNPASPAAAATTGDNDSDNVEQVIVNSPGNNSYTLRVTHKGVLADGAQAFSLIITGASTISTAPPCPLDDPPVAVPGGPYAVDEGTDLTLDGGGSFDPDAACGDSITDYAWDLNNNGTFTDAVGATPTVAWAQLAALVPPLAYPADPVSGLPSNTIRLRVTDSTGAMHTASTTLTIYRNEPVAQFTITPNPAGCGESIEFDASASSHGSPAHAIVQYEWDFDGDGTFDQAGASPMTMHSYPVFADYYVILRVTDDNVPPKTATLLLPLSVSAGNQAPIADAGAAQSIIVGQSVSLNGSASFEPDAGCGDSITQYSWDLNNNGLFGDVLGANPTVSWATLASLSPPLAYPASYATGLPTNTVVLRVRDEFGVTDTATMLLTIYAPCPGDATLDGKVDNDDLQLLLDAWAAVSPDPRYDPRVDFDGDGMIGNSDLQVLLDHWAQMCP